MIFLLGICLEWGSPAVLGEGKWAECPGGTFSRRDTAVSYVLGPGLCRLEVRAQGASGCWMWIVGSTTTEGRGQFTFQVLAHSLLLSS